MKVAHLQAVAHDIAHHAQSSQSSLQHDLHRVCTAAGITHVGFDLLSASDYPAELPHDEALARMIDDVRAMFGQILAGRGFSPADLTQARLSLGFSADFPDLDLFSTHARLEAGGRCFEKAFPLPPSLTLMPTSARSIVPATRPGDAPRVSPNRAGRSMLHTRLRALHRASAWVIVVFAALHVGNHLAAVRSVDTHVVVMQALRAVYRQPVIESLLLGSVLVQIVSGTGLVVRGWRTRVGRVAWLQALAGLYLLFFLVVHVSAVLVGRGVFGLDTNFYFAAAGFHVSPYAWFFAPYYTLAVLALFAHLGCAWYWRFYVSAPRRAAIGLASALVAGSVASVAIVLLLAGMFERLAIPVKYLAPYGGA